MDIILTALADSTIRGSYLVFCFVIMVLPMIALSYWYHSRIRETRSGRELIKEQAREGVGPHRSLVFAFHDVQAAGRIAKDIAAGRYGAKVRQIQNRIYWLAGGWLIVNVISFGILFWADEVNRATN